MPCSQLSAITSISDLLVWPIGCNYYFWLIILGTIFIITAWAIFKNDQRRGKEGDLISAIGVSSIATTFIGAIGTLIKNSDDIPMIQSNILLIMVAVTVVIVLIWIWKD